MARHRNGDDPAAHAVATDERFSIIPTASLLGLVSALSHADAFGMMRGVTIPMAYLPEHVWQVGACWFGICCIVLGVVEIQRTRGTTQGRAGVAAGDVAVVIGVGLVIAAFVINAEPGCGSCNRGHWGGTGGVLGLVGWTMVVGVLAGTSVVRRR
jgi:hypothetical protein